MQDLSPTEIEAIVKTLGNNFAEETPPQRPVTRDSSDTPYTAQTISRVQFTELEEDIRPNQALQDSLKDVRVSVDVVLGTAKIPLQELLSLQPGSLLTLDKLAGEPVDIEVNGKKVGRGEIVVVDENFGVKILEI